MRRKAYEKLLEWKQRDAAKTGCYLLHMKDVQQKDGIVYLPIYMAGCL